MKANQEDIQALIAVLAAEAELFTAYVDLLDQQRDAIVANDIERLNQVTEQQRERLATSRILDTRREALVTALKAQSAITGDVTISTLLEVVSDEDGRRLSQLRDTICDLNESIDESGQRNAFLIEKSRAVIAETLKLFNRVGAQSSQGAAYTAGAASVVCHPDARISLALDRKA